MGSLRVERTIVEKDGKGFLQFNVQDRPCPKEADLADDQVLIAIEAAPINPSDLGPLFAPSHGGIGRFDGAVSSVDSSGRTCTALPVPDKTFAALRGSKAVGRPNRVGNEGAGRVVGAGKGKKAQSLKGKLVSAMGIGGTYSQHCIAHASQCVVHHDDTTAEEAASSCVNPLTSLGMVSTMRKEGHKGIVHTAAASQLGQMLVRICKADGIPLVNVVRRQEQVDVLKAIGAEYVVNTSSKSYEKDLVDALVASGATIAFDATGGGTLAFEIIKGMETAATRTSKSNNSYGSNTFKKLYIYGGLGNAEPLLLKPFAGMGGFSWSVAGFLLNDSMIGEAELQRIANEIKTTFATHYSRRVSLEEMLDVSIMKEYQRQTSNQKTLVMPQMSKQRGRL